MSRFKWDSARGRAVLMRVLARLHCALMIALACAAVSEFMRNTALYQEDAALHALLPPLTVYLRSLLFVIPDALSWHAAKRLPHLWQYLAVSLLVSALAGFLLGHPAGTVLAAVFCFFRGCARLSEGREEFLLDTPHYWFLGIFLALFLLSALEALSITQRLSTISGVLYFLVCFIYRAVGRVDGYLSLNKTVYGLPTRRIQRIAGGAAGALALLAAFLLLPAAFQASGDIRIDVSWVLNRPNVQTQSPEPWLDAVKFRKPWIFGNEPPAFPIPPFVLSIIYVVAVLGIAVLLLYGIYRIFKNFRASFTDSRDTVQFLSAQNQEKTLEGPGRPGKRPARWDRSPNARVRRRYRKAVLHAAKDRPHAWQSPREIETAAGLSVPELHALYEKARYAQTPCTREELQSLKEKA